jgi:hypothetical protein
MVLTLHDLIPVGLCIATEDLFDSRRFRENFCDNLILRAKDPKLEPKLTAIKKELNSIVSNRKYLAGHKTAIINNIDKILALVSSRYAKIDLHTVESIIREGKVIVSKVIDSDSFAEIAALEPEFRRKVSLPTYTLFTKSLR